jgi:hypothetical protein
LIAHPAFVEAKSKRAFESVVATIEALRNIETEPFNARRDPAQWRHLHKHIYFIRGESTGLIKIGIATELERRLRDIQAMSPDTLALVRCINGDVLLERALHESFAVERRHGEWFDSSLRLIAFIDDIADLDVR